MQTLKFLSLTMAGIVFSMTINAQIITAYGTNALTSNTTGTYNAAFGYYALNANTTGNYNSAFGINALPIATTAAHNSAFGAQALLSNTSGYANTASGSGTLYTNSTGYRNTANGYSALRYNTSGNNNTAIGGVSLWTNSTGSSNTAVGAASLYSNDAGSSLVAVGANALYSNYSGTENSAVGVNTLYATYGGSYNTALGNWAMYANTSGSHNAALGYNALKANTTGSNNTVLGDGSLLSNTTGGANTVVGYNTGGGIQTGSNNTIIGANVTGLSTTLANTIILADGSGNKRLYIDNNGYAGFGTTTPSTRLEINSSVSNTSGLKFSQLNSSSPVAAGNGTALTVDASGNVILAAAGGSSNAWLLTGNGGTVDGVNFLGTTDNVPLSFRVNNTKAGRIDPSSQNTFFGSDAGGSITGNSNAAFGHQSLRVTTSVNNTATGCFALWSTTTGQGNTAVGAAALAWNTSGQNNSSLGFQSGITLANGSNNTAIGAYADVASAGTFNNSTALGSWAITPASDVVRIGDVNVIRIEGNPPVYTGSDGRFKTNITENDVKGLEFIKLLHPVVYNYDTRKFEEFLTAKMPDSIRKIRLERDFRKSTAIRHSGFIAQEVEEAAKKVSYDFDGIHHPDNENDNYSLAYGQFVVPLVKSVQELSQQNDAMQKVIDQQDKSIASLRKELNELRSMITNGKQEGSIKLTASEAKLFQNAPNPFNQSTNIRYSLPVNAKNAVIQITTADGRKIKEYNLKSTTGQNIEISGGQLSAGSYIYSLIVDDILIDSKVMILTR